MSEPPAENWISAESIRALFSRAESAYPVAVLGIEPVDIDDERAIGKMTVAERHLHPGGLVHGGIWCGFGDTVAAWQTFRHLPAGHNFTSIEMKLNALGSAALGDELTAVATHLHAGRSTHVVETRMSKGDRLVANLIVTQFVIPPDEAG